MKVTEWRVETAPGMTPPIELGPICPGGPKCRCLPYQRPHRHIRLAHDARADFEAMTKAHVKGDQ